MDQHPKNYEKCSWPACGLELPLSRGPDFCATGYAKTEVFLSGWDCQIQNNADRKRTLRRGNLHVSLKNAVFFSLVWPRKFWRFFINFQHLLPRSTSWPQAGPRTTQLSKQCTYTKVRVSTTSKNIKNHRFFATFLDAL